MSLRNLRDSFCVAVRIARSRRAGFDAQLVVWTESEIQRPLRPSLDSRRAPSSATKDLNAVSALRLPKKVASELILLVFEVPSKAEANNLSWRGFHPCDHFTRWDHRRVMDN